VKWWLWGLLLHLLQVFGQVHSLLAEHPLIRQIFATAAKTSLPGL
jgi:hypothetical protein